MLALRFAEGPLFRCTFVLMVLGVARAALLETFEMLGAYTDPALRPTFWAKVRIRLLWIAAPSIVLKRHWPGQTAPLFAYHFTLSLLSVILRLGTILVPTFMLAHVYLWERAFGVRWPALAGHLADILAIITITAGFLYFLGRLYSPTARRLEPGWSFIKPLLLILPFATGFLAMHPLWSPVDYYVVRLLHVLSACLVFVMVPFGRILLGLHTPLTRVVPAAKWDAEPDAVLAAAPARAPLGVPS